jgi:hypothetical protein
MTPPRTPARTECNAAHKRIEVHAAAKNAKNEQVTCPVLIDLPLSKSAGTEFSKKGLLQTIFRWSLRCKGILAGSLLSPNGLDPIAGYDL